MHAQLTCSYAELSAAPNMVGMGMGWLLNMSLGFKTLGAASLKS
jgi:hypothetical protein